MEVFPNGLVPRRKPTQVSLSVYPGDYDKFKKFIESLNADLKDEGEFAEEDVFSFLLTQGLAAYPKYNDRVSGAARRGRKPKSEAGEASVN